MQTFIKTYKNELILGFFIFVSFYLGLGYYALENINEGLYAEIPREMILNKNFIIPTLNFVPYFEKPPLLYWLISISYGVFGLNEFAARFIPATSAAIIPIMTYYFLKRIINERTGFIAAIILATNTLFVLMGRIVLFDMLLTALFTAGMYCFYLWYQSDHKFYLRFAYLFLAFAVLAKGLMIFIFAPIITLIFMGLNKTPFHKQIQLFDPIGIILFFLVSAPWHILASIQNSEFAWQYFINEHVLRFLDKRVPNDYHHGPWYFYFPRILVYILPWTLLSPLLLKPASNKLLNRLCWTWFLTILIFFSISKAKGDYYLIMGIPPLVILLADRISNANYSKHFLPVVYTLVTSLMFLFLLVLWVGSFNVDFAQHLPEKLRIESFLTLPLGILLGFIGVYFVFSVIFYRHILINKSLQVVLYAALMIPLVLFLLVDKKHFEFRFSEKANAELIRGADANLMEIPAPLSETLRISSRAEMTARGVYIYKHYEDLSSITFYLRRRVAIIDSKSHDLYFGSTQPEAKGWFVSLSDIQNRLQDGPIFILVKKGNYTSLARKLTNKTLTILSDNGNVYLTSLGFSRS